MSDHNFVMHRMQQSAYESFDEVVAFATVAETGSFKAAAAQLGRDASVISRRLMRWCTDAVVAPADGIR
jgi:hypothetical protein